MVAARAKPHALILPDGQMRGRRNRRFYRVDASTEFGFSENRLTTPPHRDVLIMFRLTKRGVRVVTNVGCGMRWTRRCCRRTVSKRTEKACGPGAPTLALSFVDDDPQDDGGKRARSPGRARSKPLKPSRGESRLKPSEPVVTRLVCFSTFAREAAGAAGTRLSPRPLFSRVLSSHNSDATRREKAELHPPGCLTLKRDTRPWIPGGARGQQAARAPRTTICYCGTPGQDLPLH